jgi:hypothetical protein
MGRQRDEPGGGTGIKLSEPLNVLTMVPGSLFVLLAQTSEAGADQGDGVTAVQLAVGILVFLAYAVNHYRARIRALLGGLFSGGQRPRGD